MSSRADPAVSVIIPTYNRAALLPLTVDSVLRQTFDDLEVLVVDDGSDDGTSDYLANLSDPRVQAIRLPHCGNVARLRNAGADRARGRYLCFLDSDDLWLPRKLEAQVAVSAGEDAVWCYTRYEHIDELGRRIPAKAGEWSGLSGRIALPLITTEASVSIITVLVPRRLFEELAGFDEDPGLREDHEFLVRLALRADASAISDCLALVRDHPGRTSRACRGAEPFLLSARTHEKLLGQLEERELRRAARRSRAHHLAEAGAAYLRSGPLASAAACLVGSALCGSAPRPWLSALRRGLRERRSGRAVP